MAAARRSAASRARRLRVSGSSSSRGASAPGPLLSRPGATGGFAGSDAVWRRWTWTRSPRATPHARSVADSLAPPAPRSSTRLSDTDTSSGVHASSRSFEATARRSCASVHTSGTSSFCAPSTPATRTRSLMPIAHAGGRRARGRGAECATAPRTVVAFGARTAVLALARNLFAKSRTVRFDATSQRNMVAPRDTVCRCAPVPRHCRQRPRLRTARTRTHTTKSACANPILVAPRADLATRAPRDATHRELTGGPAPFVSPLPRDRLQWLARAPPPT